MKKLTAILLVLLLLAAMTACTVPAPSTTPEQTEPNTTTVPATTVPAKQEGTLAGETVNNVYKNEFLGITCTLDEDWTVFNEEQLAQLVGVTLDIMDNDALEAAMEKGAVVTAFFAQAMGGQLNMNISLERLNLVNGILLDEESYLAIAKDQVNSALSGMGLENITMENVKLQFAGQERHGLRLRGTLQGVDFYETLVCIKIGNYMANITACSVGADHTDSMLELFQKLEN